MSTMYYCSNHLCNLKTEMKQSLIQQPQGQLCTPFQYFTIIYLIETALTKPWQKHDTPVRQRDCIPGFGVSLNYLQLSQISLAESCQSTAHRPKNVMGAGVQAVSTYQKPASAPTVEMYCILTGPSSASLFCNMRFSVPKLPWKWISM